MNLEHAYYVTNAFGQIKFWNKRAKELFGWPEIDIRFFADSPSRDESSLFLPEARECGECEWERTQAAQNGLIASERWYMRCDGSRFLGDGVLLSLNIDAEQGGETQWFIRILYDVTPQKCQLERLFLGLRRLEAEIAYQSQAADSLQSVPTAALSSDNCVDSPEGIPVRG